MDKEKIRKEWKAKVNEFNASEQTQSEWCRSKNIDLKRFNYWFKKYKEKDQKTSMPSNWMPIKLNELDEKTEQNQEPSLNIKMGQVIIEIKSDFNPNLLLKIVKTLGAIC